MEAREHTGRRVLFFPLFFGGTRASRLAGIFLLPILPLRDTVPGEEGTCCALLGGSPLIWIYFGAWHVMLSPRSITAGTKLKGDSNGHPWTGKHIVKAGECARFFVKLSGGKEGHYIGAGVHPVDSSPLVWNHEKCWVVDVNDGEVCLAGEEISDNEQVLPFSLLSFVFLFFDGGPWASLALHALSHSRLSGFSWPGCGSPFGISCAA